MPRVVFRQAGSASAEARAAEEQEALALERVLALARKPLPELVEDEEAEKAAAAAE